MDGIAISYVPKDKAAPLIKCQHGSKTSQLTTIDLKGKFTIVSLCLGVGGADHGESTDSEKLVTVFGRAGKQSYFGRSLINSIGFVIFDQATITTRVVGVSRFNCVTLDEALLTTALPLQPVGNNNKSNEGTPFHVSDVAAFGGFAQDTPDCGFASVC